jgi:hypothetical protein
MLKKLTSLILKTLLKYPTTLKQDQEKLAKDDAEHNLNLNQRNCLEL